MRCHGIYEEISKYYGNIFPVSYETVEQNIKSDFFSIFISKTTYCSGDFDYFAKSVGEASGNIARRHIWRIESISKGAGMKGITWIK